MKAAIGFIVLAGVTLGTSHYSNCPVHIPRTYKLHQFGGSCYEFNINKNTYMSWRFAEADCQEKEGRLVDIHSQTEQEFILSTSKALRNQLASSNKMSWLALNDRSTEGKWSWSNGKAEIDFHNWAPLQPGSSSNGKHEEEDCGLMVLSGEWHDFPCEDMNGWICEFNTVSNNDCPKSLPRTYNLLQWRDHCYQFVFNSLVNWNVADRNCRASGGYLVDIHSEEEQYFIYWTTWVKFRTFQSSGATGLWIGLTDGQNEGQWNWTSNVKQLDYQNWYPGQPASAGDNEDCALMDYSDNGKWHDYPCILSDAAYHHGWICKFQKDN